MNGHIAKPVDPDAVPPAGGGRIRKQMIFGGYTDREDYME